MLKMKKQLHFQNLNSNIYVQKALFIDENNRTSKNHQTVNNYNMT